MTGRGVDQILPNAGDPQLFEPCMRPAIEYVQLAETVSGPMPRRVTFDYIWGDASEDVAHSSETPLRLVLRRSRPTIA